MDKSALYRSFIDEFEGHPFGNFDVTSHFPKVVLEAEELDADEYRVEIDRGLNLVMSIQKRKNTLEVDPSKNLKISIGNGNPHDFLFQKLSIFVDGSGPTLKTTPKASPILLAFNDVTIANGLLVNAPQFRHGIKGPLFLETGRSNFSIEEFRHLSEASADQVMRYSPPVITHHFELEAKSDSALSVRDIYEEAGLITSFLGFVKGQRVGMGWVRAYPTPNEQNFCAIGFSKFDSFKCPTNWFYESQVKHLQDLFANYLTIIQTGQERQLFRRALDYYMASNNAQKDATEVAFLVSMAGLEAITYYALSLIGGWSKDLLERSNYADRIRATARLLGICDNPGKYSDDLKRRSREEGGPHYDDFSALVTLRNELTHPKLLFGERNRAPLTGNGILEAWFASQWLLEIILLRLLSYNGGYFDRRQQIGRSAGHLSEMPFDNQIHTL